MKGKRDKMRISVAATIAAAIGLTTFSAVSTNAAAAGCANEALRLQQGSAALPECRAFEMVTPAAKGSGEPEPVALGEVIEGRESQPLRPDRLPAVDGVRAATDGTRLAWVSEPLPGARAAGISYLSSRGADGWSSADVVPPMSPFNGLLCPKLLGASAWSVDLTRSILDLPAGPPASNAVAAGFKEEDECGHDEPRLVPGEPEHLRNLFLRDNLSGSHQLVNVTPPGVAWPEPQESLQRYWPASFLAASDDLGHVVFEEELALTPDAPIGYRGGNELYEWTGGAVRLVTVLPDGTPVHGALAGATRNYADASDFAGQQKTNVAQFRHAVSVDGSRIFFEAEGVLYLREDGSETVQVDESRGPGPSGGGAFMLASADGSRAFFTSENRLTPDATAEAGEPDLYEFRLRPGQPAELTDLTINAGGAAAVLGVSGAAADGSAVYVVARGALTTAPNSEGESAVAGEPNLYLLEGGTRTFIATLDPLADQCDWTANAHCGGAEGTGPSLTARVSSGGDFIAFNSVRSLTGYDNTDLNSGEADIEIHLYEAAADRLRCASCNPGARPTAGAAIHWPANPGKNNNWSNAYPQHNLSDGGQVFFETVEALLPEDGNGVRDVYQYADGGLSLLSTGAGNAGSHFLDATPDGSTVFISTAQPLLARDEDSISDYYAVRAGGGFPEPPPSPPPCGPGTCRGTGSPAAAVPAAGSSSFVGPGNPRQGCRRGHRVRRHHAKHVRTSRQGKRSGAKAKRCKRANRRVAK